MGYTFPTFVPFTADDVVFTTTWEYDTDGCQCDHEALGQDGPHLNTVVIKVTATEDRTGLEADTYLGGVCMADSDYEYDRIVRELATEYALADEALADLNGEAKKVYEALMTR